MGAKKGLGGRIPHPHIPHLSLEQVRVLRLFALLFLFSFLVLYAVFRSARFQDLMRRRTETLLSETLKRAVTIGGFDLSLVPPAFLVRDVAVANDPRGLPGACFSAEEVSLRGIPQVSETRIDLPKVRLIAPRIVFEVFGDGTNNFSSIVAALPKGEGGGRDVRVREAVLQRGTFRFREWKAKLDVILSDAALTARSGRFSRTTRASLGCRRARFKLGRRGGPRPRGRGRRRPVAGPASDSAGIRLRGDGLAVDALGGIDDLTTPEVNLVARARMRGEDLERYFGAGRAAFRTLVGRREHPGAPRRRVPREGKVRDRRGRTVRPVPDDRRGLDPGRPRRSPRPRGARRLRRGEPRGGRPARTAERARRFRSGSPSRGPESTSRRFFSDLGLPGTGLMATSGPRHDAHLRARGSEHGDGSGAIRLVPAPGVPSAVQGRHALPVSGGGSLYVKDGSIRFPRVPFVTAGGLDGDARRDAADRHVGAGLGADGREPDLVEAERLAENFYPAIQGEPLCPAVEARRLGTARREADQRSFSDPRITGRLEASPFVLRGVPFGETTADFVVDRNVLTLQPLEARDAGGRLVVTGQVEWGGARNGVPAHGAHHRDRSMAGGADLLVPDARPAHHGPRLRASPARAA